MAERRRAASARAALERMGLPQAPSQVRRWELARLAEARDEEIGRALRDLLQRTPHSEP